MSDFVFSIDTSTIEDVQNGITEIKQAVDQTPAYLESTMGGFGITKDYATKIYLINEMSTKAGEISEKLAELLEWITTATQAALDLDNKNAQDVNSGGNGGGNGGGTGGGTGGGNGGGSGGYNTTLEEQAQPEYGAPIVTPTPEQPTPETPTQPTPTQTPPETPTQPTPTVPETPTQTPPETPTQPTLGTPQPMYGVPIVTPTPEQPTPETPTQPTPEQPTPEQPEGPGTNTPGSPGAQGAGTGAGAGGAGAQPTAPTGPDELSSALKEGLNNGLDSNYKMGSAKLSSTTKPTAAGSTKGINPWAVAGLGLAAGGLALGAGLIIKNNAYYTFSPEDWQILSTPIKNAIINDFKKAGLTDEDIDKFINSTFKIKVTEFDKFLDDIKKANEVDVGLEIEINDMYGFSCFDSEEKLVKYAVFIMLIIDGINLSDEFNLYNILNISLDEEDVKMDYNGLNMYDYLEEGDLSSSESTDVVEETTEEAPQEGPLPTDMNIPQPYEGY